MEQRAITILSDPLYEGVRANAGGRVPVQTASDYGEQGDAAAMGATSRLFARFVRHDTSEEDMRLPWPYLERFGRPLAFYTDKAGMFQVAVKTKRYEQREGRDQPQMPPAQIARGLGELHVVWIPAHSAQAKGRVERQFSTAQDRLVNGLRVARARTIEEANSYLDKEYIPVESDFGCETSRCCRRA